MDRIIDYTLAGTTYKLNMSLNATKEFIKKFGSIENIQEIDSSDSIDMLDKLIYMLFVLIEQGARYEEKALGNAGTRITEEDLGTILGFPDIPELQIVLAKAMGAGTRSEIEVEIDPKNDQAAQT